VDGLPPVSVGIRAASGHQHFETCNSY